MTVRRFVASLLLLALAALPVHAGGKAQKYRTLGKVIRLDPGLDRLVPKDAKMEIIADGHVWTEGPCWVKEGGYLLFSDIPRNAIYKWQDGEESLFLRPAGYYGPEPRGGEDGTDEPGSNGLVLTPDGKNLVLCQHGNRQVAVVPATFPGPYFVKVLARDFEGKRLNSPNDGVFATSGDLYFTDPPYGMKLRYEDPARELDHCGIYKVSAKDGKLTLLTKDMTRPNGIGLSPDGKTLYAANSDPDLPVWMSFPVRKDGTLGKGNVFFDAKEYKSKYEKGLPDGMAVDADGNLFATGPEGVYVFTPDAKLLGILYTGERTSNCTFGDDGRTLYVTVDDYVTRIRLNTKGIGF